MRRMGLEESKLSDVDGESETGIRQIRGLSWDSCSEMKDKQKKDGPPERRKDKTVRETVREREKQRERQRIKEGRKRGKLSLFTLIKNWVLNQRYLVTPWGCEL